MPVITTVASFISSGLEPKFIKLKFEVPELYVPHSLFNASTVPYQLYFPCPPISLSVKLFPKNLQSVILTSVSATAQQELPLPEVVVLFPLNITLVILNLAPVSATLMVLAATSLLFLI